MSNVYQLEPPTQGKVVLVTTLGDVEIELWAKEAPKACRNFVQLALERYYDNTIFHRIIKDFMVQGGDPTGTGTGGESVYGEPFKDEIHSRLHFNHRGQVAMANTGKANDNGSQFFITLDKCPWLDRKHTIFGKVTGTTIYNVLQFGECEVAEGTDRPVEPPTIQRIDVVWNPFEDIVPRNMKPIASELLIGGEGEERGTRKRKNLALLSFGDEAEEEEEAVAAAPRARVKSIHDAVQDDARLVKAGTAAEAEVRAQLDEEWERERAARAVRDKLAGPARAAAAAAGEAGAGADDGGGEGEDFEARMRRKIMEKRRDFGATGAPALPGGGDGGCGDGTAAAPAGEKRHGETREERDARRAARAQEKEARAAARRAHEAEKLKRLGLSKLAAEVDAGLLTAGEAKRRTIKSKKALTVDREKETLAKLQRFQASLQTAAAAAPPPAAAAAPPAEREGAAGVARYVAQGLYYADEDEEEDAHAWRTHSLAFQATRDARAYAPSTDDYVVHDPLLEKGKAAFNKKQQRDNKHASEWAGKSHT